MLRCSEWWVKEQARKRRIPFAWIGGSYRFTDDHVAEIVSLFEVRPAALGPDAGPARRRDARPARESTARLTARRPRRARRADQQPPTAA
jgi:hypothetical protein